ncbi:MAG: homoserine/homoserine lactone efflux protein [Sulfurimonas sp.]|jgi:homoserine/homoserine lactone efflux protein|uniref:LysE family translocator n=1 Tax=Sulfurimonas sp. TaxID=2022749 RepID=UPI0039E3903D
MDSLNFWLLYSITVFVASIIPGPSMLLALSHGLKYGAKTSIATALGNTTASMIQATISITGLGLLLTTSNTVFMLIKYVGALYLIYLGIKLFRTPFHIETNNSSKTKNKSSRKLFNESFIIAASNPKALIFFTALFPQFINEGQNSFFDYFLLVTLLGIIAFTCMMIYSLSAYFIKDLFNKTSIGKYFGKIIGSLFIGLGASLALDRR